MCCLTYMNVCHLPLCPKNNSLGNNNIHSYIFFIIRNLKTMFDWILEINVVVMKFEASLNSFLLEVDLCFLPVCLRNSLSWAQSSLTKVCGISECSVKVLSGIYCNMFRFSSSFISSEKCYCITCLQVFYSSYKISNK